MAANAEENILGLRNMECLSTHKIITNYDLKDIPCLNEQFKSTLWLQMPKEIF